jgi:hypothetical protein
MSCKKDQKPCDPDSPVCRLNPEKIDQFYYDYLTGERRLFRNSRCCFFFGKKE